MASITVVFAPSRCQTLPSSRPMTPPPITPRRAGTAENSSAPQESTIFSPSKRCKGQLDRHRAGGQHHVLGLQQLGLTAVWRKADLVGRQQMTVTKQAGDAVGLEQLLYAAGELPNDGGLARLHHRQIQFGLADVNTVAGEFVASPVKQLRRLKQRLGRNAARIQTGATERVFPVAVLPGIDTGNPQAVLGRAYGGDVAGRPATDDHDVVLAAHRLHLQPQTPSRRRAGSSSVSFIATRNCTASRPSTMRWS